MAVWSDNNLRPLPSRLDLDDLPRADQEVPAEVPDLRIELVNGLSVVLLDRPVVAGRRTIVIDRRSAGKA